MELCFRTDAELADTFNSVDKSVLLGTLFEWEKMMTIAPAVAI